MSEEENKDSQNGDDQAPAPSMGQSIAGNGWRLAAFALVCTFFIAATQLQTKDRISEQQRQAQLRALLEIVPANAHDNDMLADKLPLYDEMLGHRQEEQLFVAKTAGKSHTLIYPAIARDGYSGDIKYIVGVNLRDNSVAGVRVLSHKETPGLGDGIELRKSDWVLAFNGKSLDNPLPEQWTVKKEGGAFDGFTGATITPRSLTQSIANTLDYHQKNVKQILAQLKQAGVSNPEEQAND